MRNLAISLCYLHINDYLWLEVVFTYNNDVTNISGIIVFT